MSGWHRSDFEIDHRSRLLGAERTYWQSPLAIDIAPTEANGGNFNDMGGHLKRSHVLPVDVEFWAPNKDGVSVHYATIGSFEPITILDPVVYAQESAQAI